MKYLTIRTWQVRCEALSNWHRWFAWYPVTIKQLPDGAEHKVWWEVVLRVGTRWHLWHESGWLWTYKELKK